MSTPTGAVGQPCNSGDTCNAPELKCVAKVCQTASTTTSGGTTSASSSGSSSSSTSSASSTGGTSSSSSGAAAECKDLTQPATTDPVLCPIGPNQFQTCGQGELCCPGNGGCKKADKCGGPDGADDWQCLARNNCASDMGCYVKQSDFLPDTDATCNVRLTIGFQASAFVSVARCLSSAPGSPWVQLCNIAGDCDNPADCEPAVLQVNGAKVLVKACKEK